MEKLPEFEIIRSSRRTVILEVTREGKALVRAPLHMKRTEIDAFVLKHREWLISRLEHRRSKNMKETISKEKQTELTALAKLILPQKTEYFSKIMNVEPSAVKITSAKTRWGSCSSKNSICFSWRLMLYPEKAIDYVVIHELSHILHHDHGKEFWKTVEKYMPDYKEAEKLLRN